VYKWTLYLGSDPKHYQTENQLYHYPVIKIVPRPFDAPEIRIILDDLQEFTHFLFTSKNSVRVFFECLKTRKADLSVLQNKCFICVGKITANVLNQEGFQAYLVAKDETQEGIIQELKFLDLENAYVLFPRSTLSRPAIANFLAMHQVRHQLCDLYDTEFQKIEPVPNLHQFDEIVFTSPSTIKGFFKIFSQIPKDIKIKTLGPITTRTWTDVSRN
jgi:uroporphyrinogen-III synthase